MVISHQKRVEIFSHKATWPISKLVTQATTENKLTCSKQIFLVSQGELGI